MPRYIDADLLQEDFKADHGGKRSLMIDTQPTADVRENVRGEWIETDTTWTAMTEATTVQIPSKICSVCQKPVPQIMWNNFCPNCGADMRG